MADRGYHTHIRGTLSVDTTVRQIKSKMMDEISDEQLMRYARHVVLEEVGEEGQIKLLESKVLVIGAGGLGSPVLMYLAAAGVGTLGVVDDDVRSLS